ncbi:MAG TPA: pantoate--beta-alanine ligase [Phycisphaerae bacterium]|nr:pantoate--beta-alanine ligase [Phycisphaerae bacterium]
MLLAETIADVRTELAELRRSGARVGLVPTMGALHAGHWSLVERCVRECGVAVVSLFVNPLQFGPQEDLARYPQTHAEDRAGCRQRGVALLFSPSAEEMYGGGVLTRIRVAELGEVLCGATRPGHFDGVCTVVCKLFNIVQPDVAYFGEKDFQQLVVIRRMVRDLSLQVEIVGCPIVRAEDGLALSSRNAYLSADERRRAPAIHEALQHAQTRVRAGERDARTITAEVERLLRNKVDVIEYVALVDTAALTPVDTLRGPARLCAAVRLGSARLIDNVAVDGGEQSH